MTLEETLVIFKPDLVASNRMGEALVKFEAAALFPRGVKLLHLTQADARAFYAIHRERPFFESLIEFMTSGPVLLLAFRGENVVSLVRTLIGATDPAKAASGTIRAQFGSSIDHNAVHGSDSPANGSLETSFFFARHKLMER